MKITILRHLGRFEQTEAPTCKRIRMVAGGVMDLVRLCYFVDARHCGDTIALDCALQVLHSMGKVYDRLSDMQEAGHAKTIDGRIQAKRLSKWLVSQIQQLWGIEDPYPSILEQPMTALAHPRASSASFKRLWGQHRTRGFQLDLRSHKV